MNINNYNTQIMRPLQVLIPVFITVLLSGCATAFRTDHELFRIKDIYYRSWMLQDQEKGTDVYVELVNADPDVVFTKLVFRGIEVDVISTTEGRKTAVKGVINTGPSIIENYDYDIGGTKDVIRYIYKAKEFEYPLKNVRRENSDFIE